MKGLVYKNRRMLIALLIGCSMGNLVGWKTLSSGMGAVTVFLSGFILCPFMVGLILKRFSLSLAISLLSNTMIVIWIAAASIEEPSWFPEGFLLGILLGWGFALGVIGILTILRWKASLRPR